eukprot:TRINITY_DN2669_c0_g2_i1.p1 TRINITY_DN2669_c0_g2~~TRINITY_DN2669_c0_g2_i1.p1  ORF type:complete len:611 (+),score=113.16 TRINITY_DN2669_c0_g2_i1:144-1976(+)
MCIRDSSDIASIVNQHFIPVLVDCEEHPDVDRMLMNASSIMGCGSGGWPLHVLLTPECKPFFCGHSLDAKPFKEMISRMAKIWDQDREPLIRLSDMCSAQLLRSIEPSQVKIKLDGELFRNWLSRVSAEFDEVCGGFGRPVKFACVPRLQLALRLWRRSLSPALETMLTGSLVGMCTGGLFDQLGGGFFRCSSDVCWQIPQFDKHLAHNALLATLYGEAHQAFGEHSTMYLQVCRSVLEFMLGSLRASNGCFYSSLHSSTGDSEGSYYLWKYDDLVRRLSEDEFKLFAETFGVTEWGNFENGSNHLRVDTSVSGGWEAREQELVQLSITKLKAARQKREVPAADDKVVAAWNGLAISALAKAHEIFLSIDHTAALKYLTAAQTTAREIKTMLWRQGLLYRVGSTDPAHSSHTGGLLEDYAYLVQGLLALYQQDWDAEWLVWVDQLQDAIDQQFGGLGKCYSHAPLHSALLPPFQDFSDHGELPSPMSVCISNLLTLNALNGSEPQLKAAERLLLAVGDSAVKSATTHSQYLSALDLYMDSQVVTIVSEGDLQEEAGDMFKAMGTRYLPQAIICASTQERKCHHPAVLHDRPLGICAVSYTHLTLPTIYSV